MQNCSRSCWRPICRYPIRYDAKLEPSVEVHSSWGTFEWILNDAFDCGYKIGIVASSDGHKGRPGSEFQETASSAHLAV